MYSSERSRFISGGFNVKHDCFAYDKDLQRCKALNDLYCLNGECEFYKTMQERCKGCRDAVGKTMNCSECQKLNLK